MRYVKSRKYPITHMKKAPGSERYLDMGVTTAAGLVAVVFGGGILLGYMIKKWCD